MLDAATLDEDENLAASACASLRFRPRSRLAGITFNGLVSGTEPQRRSGFGALVTAALLRDSHRAWGWQRASANTKRDNAPSRAVLTFCGPRHDPE